MIFDFIIIPVDNTYINIAYYIQYKLEDIYSISNIIIDINYEHSFSSRIDKIRQKKYNIITIGQDYEETNMISVMFQHTGFIVETMSLRDFFKLIPNYIVENDDVNNSSCIII